MFRGDETRFYKPVYINKSLPFLVILSPSLIGRSEGMYEQFTKSRFDPVSSSTEARHLLYLNRLLS